MGLDELPRRDGVQPIERLRRDPKGRVLLVRSEQLGEHPRERRCRRVTRRLVQRSEGQWLPQQLPQARRLAVADEPILDGLTGRGGADRLVSACLALGKPHRASDPQHRDPVN